MALGLRRRKLGLPYVRGVELHWVATGVRSESERDSQLGLAELACIGEDEAGGLAEVGPVRPMRRRGWGSTQRSPTTWSGGGRRASTRPDAGSSTVATRPDPLATDREINCPSAGNYVSAYREIGMAASTWARRRRNRPGRAVDTIRGPPAPDRNRRTGAFVSSPDRGSQPSGL